jgi:hypothetical protein
MNTKTSPDKNEADFIKLFREKGHIPRFDSKGYLLIWKGTNEDGHYDTHPTTTCDSCGFIICWMCVLYHLKNIDPCTNQAASDS